MDKVSTNTLTTLISFNCKSLKRSFNCIRALSEKADIIGLQETWLLPNEIPVIGEINRNFSFFGKSGMDTSKGVLRGRPYGGVALMWRNNRFDSVSVIPCCSERIVAIKVCASERSCLIFNVYMPTDSNENLVEFVNCLSEITAIVETNNVENIYVMGDFNAHPGELFCNEMLNFCSEQNWVCADFIKLKPDTYTFVSDAQGCSRWLDHCLVSEAARKCVISVKVHYNVYWSDHFPIEIQCDMAMARRKIAPIDKPTFSRVTWGERAPTQIEIYTEICNIRFRLIEFPIVFRQCCDNMCYVSSHRLEIDKLYDSIVCVLIEAAERSFMNGEGRSKRYTRSVLGWNKYVKDAHRDARQKFKNWVWHGRPRTGILYSDMLESRRIFKHKLRCCQSNRDQIKMDYLASRHKEKDFRGFWKYTKKLSPKPEIPVSVDGVSQPAGIASMFANQFKTLPRSKTVREAGAEGVVWEVPDRVTANQIVLVIKSMTGGKSPGHDSLSIEHLQHAGPHLPRLLALLFTLCLRHSYLPRELMRTVVVPILKNRTGDVSDKENYRPISLATIVAKVFDGVLERKLIDHLKLNDAQFGFRPGLSTECAIFSLKHIVRYYTDRNTPVYAAFLDLSRAFDLVDYDLLWSKLYESGVPHAVVAIFKYWYGNQVNQVRWMGQFSDEYRLECGVRQGGLTSPLLFSLYINRLLDELGSTRVGCSIGGKCVNNINYADDMVLLSPSIRALRRLVTICEAYAESHGLVYNVTKSKLLVFRAGNRKHVDMPSVTLVNAKLDQVSHFKYLGHVVSEDLKDDADMERERRALAVRSNMLARRFARCTQEVKVLLFKTFCQNLYTCALWVRYTRGAYNALRIQYNNAFRVLLGLPRFCSASNMFAVRNTDSFGTIVRKRTASLMRRIRGGTNGILKVMNERLDCPLMWHMIHAHVYMPGVSKGQRRYMN